MKNLRIVLVLVLLSFIFPVPASSQAVVVKDHVWHLNTGYKTYDSYDAQGVYTPGGNINLRINFQMDMNDPLVLVAIEEGPITFDFFVTTGSIVVPCTVTVFPNGRLKVNGHLH
jgi:hypothetical protein